MAVCLQRKHARGLGSGPVIYEVFAVFAQLLKEAKAVYQSGLSERCAQPGCDCAVEKAVPCRAVP